jgi:hypothetical protein
MLARAVIAKASANVILLIMLSLRVWSCSVGCSTADVLRCRR